MNAEPELIWGLLSRGLGIVFLVSFASLQSQVLRTAGSRGITPIAQSLAAIRRHFPTWKRYAYFPSLLWLNSSDGFLLFLPRLGLVAAASLVIGGPHTAAAFAVCYLVYISLDRPMVLVYPWDCLLFEAGFWGIFLPATHVLPSLGAVSAPLPAVAWVFRLMVFRLILGFGKVKFAGATPQDRGFLKSFYVNQPLPNAIGWFAHRLPMWVHAASLSIMFLLEVPLPFAVFFPGTLSVIAALLLMALMINIWLIGNFGYFNLAAIVLCLSWFDTRTASAFQLSALTSPDGPVLIHALVLAHTIAALIHFPFTTFIAQTWTLWPIWLRVRPRFLSWPVALMRALHPFRLVHAYGVFPPRTPPPLKAMPVIEVTWDQKTWHPLEKKYAPTVETSRPNFCAPHHDRFDQAVVYEGLGLNEASIMRNAVGRFDPYGNGGIPAALMVLHRIVEGTLPAGFFKRGLEQHSEPPLAARARTYIFEPTTPAELKQTGKWWRRTLVGPHFPTVRRGEGYWERPLPEAEQWHFDDIIWVHRSHLGRLMRRAVAGDDVHELVLVDAADLSREHIEEFWGSFLSAATAQGTHDWSNMRARVEALRGRYSAERLNSFERLWSRYSLLLYAKLEPGFLAAGLKPVLGSSVATPNVKTTYHLRMLCQHIVSEGRTVFERVLGDPASANDHVPAMTMQSGLFPHALFRYEQFVYQSQKLRFLYAYANHHGRSEPSAKQREKFERNYAMVLRVFGSLEVAEFLQTQFMSEADVLDTPEEWPHFFLSQTGDVTRVPPQEVANLPPLTARGFF